MSAAMSVPAMNVQDVSQNRRIASLTKLMRELEQSRTPQQTIRTLQRGFSETDGFGASMLLSTRGLPRGQYRVVQMLLDDGPFTRDHAEHAPISDGPVQGGGVVAAIIGRPEPQLIQDVDWSSDPYFRETLSGYSSVMAIPFAGDRLPMTWVILLEKPPERFTVLELETAVERVALVGALLENQTLAEQLARANERIDGDARQVGALQRALLPATLPQIAGLEIAVSYQPSGRAGGDLYDFFPLDDRDDNDDDDGDDAPDDGNGAIDRWCFVIGDAAGHGLAAAVVMTIVQSVLHAHPPNIAGPADLLVHANRQLCRKKIGGFFTAFLAIYHPRSRQLTYAIAGHPRPLLKRSSDGAICPLDAVASYPLGILESEIFAEATVPLESGDVVLLYTDGITEARGGDDADLFGQDRLMGVFHDAGDRPADLIHRLAEAVCAHEQGHDANDDQTLVAARVL
jgi:sigma-B regulation protein RsbU (phosphoserine phosphatase)